MESGKDCVYGTVLCIHYMIPFSNKFRYQCCHSACQAEHASSEVAVVSGGDQRSYKMARTEKDNKI